MPRRETRTCWAADGAPPSLPEHLGLTQRKRWGAGSCQQLSLGTGLEKPSYPLSLPRCLRGPFL